MGKSRIGRSDGWRRNLPDPRNWRADIVMLAARAVTIPDEVDLRPKDTPVYAQLTLGACTANAAAGAMAFDMKQSGQEDHLHNPSRLFIYYNTRDIEDSIETDSGASITDTMKAVQKYWACEESLWPYDVAQFAARPTDAVYADAAEHTAPAYYSVDQTESAIELALAARFPVDFGMSVFDSFEGADVARTGNVPNTDTANESMVGGHSMLIVGYLRKTRLFIVRNSRGPSWGDAGYCYIPMKYLLNPDLASDFQIIKVVS